MGEGSLPAADGPRQLVQVLLACMPGAGGSAWQGRNLELRLPLRFALQSTAACAPFSASAGKGKEEAKDFMGGFGLGSVVEQLADLKLGEGRAAGAISLCTVALRIADVSASCQLLVLLAGRAAGRSGAG